MLRYVLTIVILFVIGCTNEPTIISDPLADECKNVEVIDVDDSLLATGPVVPLVIPIRYHFIYTDTVNYLLERVYDISTLDIVHQKLNEAYKGKIIFKRDSINRYHVYQYNLAELYDDYKYGRQELWNRMVADFSEKGMYNVFIVQTDKINPITHLLGFTPVLTADFGEYKVVSPRYDNIAVSYIGLFDYEAGTTVIHETGHWLGLSHPFELDYKERLALGLNSKYKICINYMNYNCFVAEFTDEQLAVQYNFAKKYRKYLMQ